MLSRTAAHLYWIGRYMERAEFTSRLVEATIRLSALGDHDASEQAWRSALSVVGAAQAFAASGPTRLTLVLVNEGGGEVTVETDLGSFAAGQAASSNSGVFQPAGIRLATRCSK